MGYLQQNNEGCLCIIAKSDVERDEWMALIRNLIRSNSNLADKFHPFQWSAGRWICCSDTSRSNPGCEPITWTPRQTKSDPVPPLPASVIVAAEAVAAAAAARGGGSNNELNAETANALLNPSGVIANPNVITGSGSGTGVGKIVIAVYPFTAIEPGDLTLNKGMALL